MKFSLFKKKHKTNVLTIIKNQESTLFIGNPEIRRTKQTKLNISFHTAKIKQKKNFIRIFLVIKPNIFSFGTFQFFLFQVLSVARFAIVFEMRREKKTI